MVVMKFGGASLRDGKSVKQISKIIKKRLPEQPIIVLSAVNGITDILLRATKQALEDESTIVDNLNQIASVHRKLVAETISSPPIRTRTQENLDMLISRLERVLYGVAYTSELTPRTCDLVMTFGERMSVHLLAGRLNAILCPAEALYADEIDLLAHGDWGRGTADVPKCRKLIPNHLKPLIQQGTVPVITGFFGRTVKNLPIIFGRGGTDYSAAVIADAMQAKQLEVWKDVDGFLSTAPEISPNGYLLEYLSYEEAAELAYFGAKILHPRTVEPLMERNLPLIIKNTFKTDCEGTVIGPERFTHKQVIKSVTYDKNIAVLRIYGASVGYQVGLLKNLVSALSDYRINIKSVITSQTCINLLIDRQDLAESYEHLNQIKLDFVDHIEPVDDIALISVVGEGLIDTPGLAARVFSVVARSDTNVEMISSGASRVAFYFIIKRNEVEKTVRAIHDEFFNNKDSIQK
jgi:aspartate kinase